MDQTDRVIYPYEKALLIIALIATIILGIALLIGFRGGIYWVLLVSSSFNTLIFYIRRKHFAISLTNYGIKGPDVFSKEFIPWENITLVDYTDRKRFGLQIGDYPRIIILSSIAGAIINISIELYDRKDILGLLDEIVKNGKSLVLNPKLLVTVDYRILPNE